MLTRKPATSVIRVLVVDDSSFMRNAITRHIQRDARFHVVGTAVNGREAVAKARELRPDVITMDVEMPEMNGIEALRQILAQTAIPVIMVSSQTEAGAKTTIQALQYGAMDFIPKKAGFEQLHEKLHAVVGAARARLAPIVAVAAPRAPPSGEPRVGPLKPAYRRHRQQHRRPARAASGARTPARALSRADRHRPAHAAAIHRRHGQMAVRRLRDQDRRGGGRHGPRARRRLCRAGRDAIPRRQRTRENIRGQGESLYKPSVDILADSAAACYGGDVLAIMLTGMGNDGARGFCKLKEAGAYVMAQDQATSSALGHAARRGRKRLRRRNSGRRRHRPTQ